MRIGIYGGTFDPIHTAHIDIARAALEQAKLDCVLFVVAARPPHKEGGPLASAEDRYAMVEAALAGESRMVASRIELDRAGPSYTVDTLKALDGEFPGAEFLLIIGLDMAADFPKWRDVQGILSRASILVVPRPGPYDIPESIQDHCFTLDFPPVEVSSTEVRERVMSGGDLSDLLPKAVADMIWRRQIYSAKAPFEGR